MIKKLTTIILISAFLLNAMGLPAFARASDNYLRVPAKNERPVDDDRDGIDDLKQKLSESNKDNQPRTPDGKFDKKPGGDWKDALDTIRGNPALLELARAGNLTIKEYRKFDQRVSEVTNSRDFAELVRRGYLIPDKSIRPYKYRLNENVNGPDLAMIDEDDDKDQMSLPSTRGFDPDNEKLKKLNTTIEKQFSNDPILLRRIKVVLPPEDMSALLDVRQELDRFYAEGKIRFSPTLQRHSAYILNRMAFQLVFILPDTYRNSFTAEWLEDVGQLDEKAPGAARGVFVGQGKFKYKMAIERYCIPPFGKEENFDEVVSSESGHFAQRYIVDTFNLDRYQGVGGEIFDGFEEAIENLQEKLYIWIKSSNPDLLIFDNEVAWQTPGHVFGLKWARQIMEKLKNWVAKGQINLEDLPKYMRACTQLLSSIDSTPISHPGDEALLQLHQFSFLTHIIKVTKSDAIHRLSFVLRQADKNNIGHLLEGDNAKLLHSRGIDIGNLIQWVDKIQRFYQHNQDAAEVAFQAMNELMIILKGVEKITSQIFQEVKDYATQIVNEILSIDSPEKLLRRATNQLINDYKKFRKNPQGLPAEQARNAFEHKNEDGDASQGDTLKRKNLLEQVKQKHNLNRAAALVIDTKPERRAALAKKLKEEWALNEVYQASDKAQADRIIAEQKSNLVLIINNLQNVELDIAGLLANVKPTFIDEKAEADRIIRELLENV